MTSTPEGGSGSTGRARPDEAPPRSFTPLPIMVGLGVLVVLLGWRIGSRGLFESSEARYGSLAAEMVRSGDWLVPRLNGVARFEKPPFSMWAMAVSMLVFGESELALRLPGLVAALVGVGLAYLLARRGGRPGDGIDRSAGAAAAIFVAISPLYFVQSKLLSTDIYLAVLTAAVLWCSVRALELGQVRFYDAAAALAALGFLTKGPVIWVTALLPVAAEMIWSRRFVELRELVRLRRLLIFGLLASPWFIAAGWRIPGLWGWWVMERSAKALYSSREFHGGPFFYYLPVFLLGFLPASLLLLGRPRILWAHAVETRRRRVLLLATAIPLAVFTLSASKLASYVLPAVIPAAALAAHLAVHHPSRRVLGGVGFLLCAFGIMLVGPAPSLLSDELGVEPESVRLCVLAGALWIAVGIVGDGAGPQGTRRPGVGAADGGAGGRPARPGRVRRCRTAAAGLEPGADPRRRAGGRSRRAAVLLPQLPPRDPVLHRTHRHHREVASPGQHLRRRMGCGGDGSLGPLFRRARRGTGRRDRREQVR